MIVVSPGQVFGFDPASTASSTVYLRAYVVTSTTATARVWYYYDWGCTTHTSNWQPNPVLPPRNWRWFHRHRHEPTWRPVAHRGQEYHASPWPRRLQMERTHDVMSWKRRRYVQRLRGAMR